MSITGTVTLQNKTDITNFKIHIKITVEFCVFGHIIVPNSCRLPLIVEDTQTKIVKFLFQLHSS